MSLHNEIMKMQQVVIEDKYSKHNIREKVYKDIEYSLDYGLKKIYENLYEKIEEYMNKTYYDQKEARLDHIRYEMDIKDVVMELFIGVMGVDKWTPIQGIAAKIGNNLGYSNIWEGVKTGAELLALGKHAGLVLIRKDVTGSLIVLSAYGLEESTNKFILETKYLPPMIVPPVRLHCNNDSGYLTIKDSVILGKDNHHYDRQALDVINKLNKVRYSLDEDILAINEEPSDNCNTAEKVNNFRAMALESKKVYADLIDLGNTFYFTHKFDKRGRIYSQGYHCNLQSTEYKKAILNFKRKEIIK